MPRPTLAAILGWLTLVGMVYVLFSLAFLVLGVDTVFQPVSYEVTRTWSFTGVVLNLIAAVIAGVACIAAGGDRRSVTTVAVMVLLFGALMLLQTFNASDNPAGLARMGDVTNFQAMLRARQPLWVTIVNPVVTIAGVFAGARLWRKPTDPRRAA